MHVSVIEARDHGLSAEIENPRFFADQISNSIGPTDRDEPPARNRDGLCSRAAFRHRQDVGIDDRKLGEPRVAPAARKAEQQNRANPKETIGPANHEPPPSG
jgi:hypothetical protein